MSEIHHNAPGADAVYAPAGCIIKRLGYIECILRSVPVPDATYRKIQILLHALRIRPLHPERITDSIIAEPAFFECLWGDHHLILFGRITSLHIFPCRSLHFVPKRVIHPRKRRVRHIILLGTIDKSCDCKHTDLRNVCVVSQLLHLLVRSSIHDGIKLGSV